MFAEQFENNYTTQLNGSINSTDTTIVVDAVPAYMRGNFVIRIDDEFIRVGNSTTTSFTECIRGVEGSTAASHTDNTVVKHVLTAGALTNALNDVGVVDDINLGRWIDGPGFYFDTGMEVPSANITVQSTAGPWGGPALETAVNLGPTVCAMKVPVGSIVRVDLWAKPTQGGGSLVTVTTGGADTNISTATAATWTRVIRLVKIGSDGLLQLKVSFQHQLADIKFTLIGKRHLFDFWINGSGTTTDNGLSISDVTRDSNNAPDGSATLITGTGAGPTTMITYSNLPVGHLYEISLMNEQQAGGSTFIQAVTAAGSVNITSDSVPATFSNERGRVVIGSDGSLVIKHAYQNEFFDLRVWDLGLAPIHARVSNSGSLSLTNGSRTTVTFDTDDEDYADMHSTSSNTEKVNILIAGEYLVNWGGKFSTGGSAESDLFLRKNGSSDIAVTTIPGGGAIAVWHTGTWTGPLAVGDDVKIEAYIDQSSKTLTNHWFSVRLVTPTLTP